jgi:hypothetical protein
VFVPDPQPHTTMAVTADELRTFDAGTLLAVTSAVESLNVGKSLQAVDKLDNENIRSRMKIMVENYRFRELLCALDEAKQSKQVT